MERRHWRGQQGNGGRTWRQGEIETRVEALAGSFREYSEQSRKLSGLYELAKQRNQQLAKAGQRIGRDMAFLREYCQALENELALRGYYKHQQQEMLSRKETADGIFLTYAGTEEEDEGLSTPPSPLASSLSDRILNQRLQAKGGEEALKYALGKAQQRIVDLEQELRAVRRRLEGEVRSAQERLAWERERLQWQRQRKGAASFVLQERSTLFSNIHSLIGQYKRKISLLGHEKKEVEKKYKQLKEKVSRLDEHSEYKLIELYTEKIDVLQKLTEKQQAEIENTIELYEVQLIKIEERRRQEIQACQNQRLDLQTQNLRLCIDLQKSLNSKDELAMQLMQEKNKNEILLQEIIQLREAIRNYKLKETLRKNLSLKSNILQVILFPEMHSQTSISQPPSQENSNADLDYQFSEIEDRKELIEKLEDISIRRESSAKKSIRDKITITYGQPYMLKPHYRPTRPAPAPFPARPHPPSPITPTSAPNKSYDSLLQYKRRFIERKPQSSLQL